MLIFSNPIGSLVKNFRIVGWVAFTRHSASFAKFSLTSKRKDGASPWLNPIPVYVSILARIKQ